MITKKRFGKEIDRLKVNASIIYSSETKLSLM